MNKYVAIYYGKKVVIEAATIYEASMKARAELKVPSKKIRMMGIMLAEKDGVAVIHDGAELP